MMNWLLFYFTRKPPLAADKKVRLSPHQTSHSPQENIWVLLRKTHEKTAQMGGNFPKSSFVVHPAGFEPATPGSEDQCSNPLSYGCA